MKKADAVTAGDGLPAGGPGRWSVPGPAARSGPPDSTESGPAGPDLKLGFKFISTGITAL